jgi:tetratricopeptide (TPR) repeat protein
LRDHEDFEEAKTLFQESFSKCKLFEDNVIAAHALQGLGMVALKTLHYREAHEHLGDALEIMQRIGDDNCASNVLANLAQIAQHDGDYDQAIKLQQQSLQGFKNIHLKGQIALGFARLATLANLSGSNLRAARLLGAAEAYRNLSQPMLIPVHREEYEGLVSEFQKLRKDEVFKHNYADGFAMSLEDAIAYALEEIGEI